MTPNVPPTVALLVMVAEFNVAAPLVLNVVRLVLPVTPSVPPHRRVVGDGGGVERRGAGGAQRPGANVPGVGDAICRRRAGDAERAGDAGIAANAEIRRCAEGQRAAGDGRRVAAGPDDNAGSVDAGIIAVRVVVDLHLPEIVGANNLIGGGGAGKAHLGSGLVRHEQYCGNNRH